MEHKIEIEFTKMTGAGNDFILVDLFDKEINPNWSQIAPVLCNRRYGIGADGLLVISRSKKADFIMNYFNADGSYGGMCGNGGRCAALYYFKKFSRTETKFEALDYIYHAKTIDGNIKLQMKEATRFYSNTLTADNEVIPYSFIDTGTAHVVIFLDEVSTEFNKKIQSDKFNYIGAQIRNNKHFAPGGTNVNFVLVIDDHKISMRTYERGVEEETLACGTGAVASAIVTSKVKQFKPPITVLTRSNELLDVTFQEREGSITDVNLTGPAKEVFQGKVEISF